ncbi:MAG TPA: hypothetical protein VHD83_19000 [Puia sp.]|nr:hypothetical protein [Puia sp.]
MRIIFVPALLFSLAAFGQWDTAYHSVAMSKRIDDPKIVVAQIGEKALIYVGLTPLMTGVKDDTGEAKRFLDSASRQSDTINIDFYYTLKYFEYPISGQLIKGNAMVYYQRQHAFVDTILHRFERYDEHGDRFFYLPDKRPFFFVMELSGILDREPVPPGKNYQGYLEEGKKMAGLREY